MSRKLFDDMKRSEEVNKGRIEYNPAEDKLVDSELVSKLLEHYVCERDYGKLNLFSGLDFEPEVRTIETRIKGAGNDFQPQYLINALTALLRDESDRETSFTRTQYLTAVVQALFNLNRGSEFAIDIRGWPEDRHDVGSSLKGRPDNLLTLNVYGDLEWCGDWAEYCNFIVHGDVYMCAHYGGEHCNFLLHNRVELCGDNAVDCSFTFYDEVKHCGNTYTDNCTFSLMPGAEIIEYKAGELQSMGNVLRKMNEDGEWEILRDYGTRIQKNNP